MDESCPMDQLNLLTVEALLSGKLAMKKALHKTISIRTWVCEKLSSTFRLERVICRKSRRNSLKIVQNRFDH